MEPRLINVKELRSAIHSFQYNTWMEYMVINPHKLTHDANEWLYYYRKYCKVIELAYKKEVDGVVLYYYRKRGK